MATKKISLHIPGSTKPVTVTVEETILFSQVMTQLMHKEKLFANRDYIISDAQGDEVSPNTPFGRANGTDFVIEERTAISPEIPTSAAGAGFTGGEISGPRSFHQLGILVLDGSGSMAGSTIRGMSKADAVNTAVRGLLTRFKVSGKKENFSFAIVTFSNDAKIHTDVTSADVIDDNGNYDPLEGHGGGTSIHEGLKLAGKIADQFMADYVPGGVPQSVALVVLSDGMCSNPTMTKQTADNLKASGRDIFSVYLNGASQSSESDNGKDLLMSIVSNTTIGFKEAWDANTLRDFFVASMSAPANN